MLVVAFLIKIDSKGPVFFTQARNGFNGRTFRIIKFRTMTVLEDAGTIQQAVRNDRRVTRIGRWLRRLSIDELPQLFNVLVGEMSIAGPRPHAVVHNSEYGRLIERYAFRHRVKPGLTGWAQVNGLRGETSTLDQMIKRVELDIWYINNWSLALDIKILLRTVFVTLLSESAY
jgi:undecaprenyl-phosphate galactose phosphotransferase/putative colanic acid biosynthesis UDP-glucose lipid carrier transferase